MSTRTSTRRALKLGCLSLLLLLCAGISTLVMALRSGPIELLFPGDNQIKVGSDDFVMSDYSFKNGSTYFLDLNGNGVRNILQMHYLSDDKRIEVVFHHADNDVMQDHQLITLSLP